MSATSIILIAVIALIVLAGASFATLARRSDVRGAGALSDETVARDRAARKAAGSSASTSDGAAVEAEAAAVRAGTDLMPATPYTAGTND